MKELITKKEQGYIHLVNDLTKDMDEYLIPEIKNLKYCGNTYIYDHSIDGVNWAIRFPGATRGGIKVDKDMTITDIRICKDIDSIYLPETLDMLKEKYIGAKLVIIR